MPIPAAPLIVAGASLAGQAINAGSQANINKKTRKWNEKMYAQQRGDSLSDWQMQNEYNTPKAQMQRFKDANLNPHLIYGQGDSGNSFQVRSSDSGNWSPDAPKIDLGGAAQSTLNAHFDSQIKKQEIDNMTAQNSLIRSQKMLADANTDKTLSETATGTYNLEYQKSVREILTKNLQAELEGRIAGVDKTRADTKYTLDQNERQAVMQVPQVAKLWQEIQNIKNMTPVMIEKLKAEIENLKKDGTLKEYEIQLNKQGLQKNDSLIWRTLSKLVAGGIDVGLGDGPVETLLKRLQKK